MTNRERALNILNFKKADRLPAVHFGYWWELLLEWMEQGHLKKELIYQWSDGNDADREIDKIIGWDGNWCTCTGGNLGLSPQFEYKVLEELPNGFKRVQNADGLIERIREGAGSIPAEDDYQLKDREAFEKLYKNKMQYLDSRIDIESMKKYQKAVDGKTMLGLNVGSVLGSIRNMLSVVGMSYMLCDDYELFGEIIDTYADMQYKTIEKILQTGIKFDFAHYWEDVCFKNGPLISPTMFEDLCAKHYKKRNELLNKYGINIISLDCDGVTEKLLPTWFENGVNTMFPIEVGTWGDQFESARKKYGNNMLGVGAMDKTAFRKDKAAVDAEIERMKRLVDLGGFIPCPDHRIMPGSKFELVQYYTDKIKSIKL